MRRWQQDNAEHLAAYHRRWQQENPDKKRAQMRRYRECKADDPEYRERERARHRAYKARKRAQKSDATPEAGDD